MNEKRSHQPIDSQDARFADRRLERYVDDQSDEIDLIEIMMVIWRGKLIIMLFTVLFAIAAAYYALSAMPQYRVSVLLAPASIHGTSTAMPFEQFSNLGSALGFSMPEQAVVAESVARLNSRQFIVRFIEEYQIRKELFKGLWDDEREVWLEPKPSTLGDVKKYVQELFSTETVISSTRDYRQGPTDEQAYTRFKSMLSINEDRKTSLVTLSILYKNPNLATSWANGMVHELNLEERARALNKTRDMITSLQEKLNDTPLREVRISISNLIEEQFKLLTLAQTQEAYSFRVIDPAFASETPAKPKKTLIVMSAAFIGSGFGVLVVFVLRVLRLRSDKAQ